LSLVRPLVDADATAQDGRLIRHGRKAGDANRLRIALGTPYTAAAIEEGNRRGDPTR
jgi:hypothetical protein